MRKMLLRVGFAIIGLLLIVVLGIALFVDVDRFRPQLERSVTSALGRKVEIGRISLSLMSGSVSIENLSVADDASFGTTPFLKAKAVRVGIAVLPLVLSKSLRVRSFRLQEPELTLRRSTAGTWNFSTLGASSPLTSTADGSSPRLNLSVDNFAITNGRVMLQTRGASGKSRVWDDVNLEVRDFSSTSRFPFHMSVRAPGNGIMKLDGTAGPLSLAGVGATPLEANLDLKHLDIASTGLVEPSAGIAGLVSLALRVVSDGRRVALTGSFRGDRLQFMPGGAPAAVPVEIACEVEYDLGTDGGTVKRGDVHIGKAAAGLTGRFSTSGESVAVLMKLAGHQMPLPDLEATLPAIGVTVPQGMRFQSGTLDADLTITGPLDRVVVAGPLKLSDAKLAGFDLGARMRTVAAFAGLPTNQETVIQTLSASLHIAPDGIRAEALKAIVPAIGSLEGDGHIAPNGAMNFRMLAKLNRTSAISDRVMRVASLGRPENGIPFRIEGTTSQPVFVPDIGRAVGNLVKSPSAVSDAVGFARTLLGKKKKEP